MDFRSIIPKMHGATSIWLAAMVLSLPELSPLEFLASLSVFFAVAAGHNVIFKGKADRWDYLVLSVASALISFTALQNPVIFLYSIPLLLSVAFRKDFRKYVIFSSLLTTIPASYISSEVAFLLFVSFSFAGVLLADSFIYSDRRTGVAGIVQYALISLLTAKEMVVMTSLLILPFLVKMRLKTLGLYLLFCVLAYSLSLLLIIYHV
ncbi:MAG: hypothetical protein GXO67_08295 [Archaeoglobi archaeon]|nr:hypothetical protein [Archaeoglobi archaeon]